MRTTKIVIGLVAIGFVAGLLGGYTIWKPKEDANADLRQLIAKAGEAADRIVRRNEELVSQVESLKGDAGEAKALKAENQALKGRLDNTVEQFAAARREAQQAKDLQASNDELRSRISALESENAQLRSVIDNISVLTHKKEAAQ